MNKPKNFDGSHLGTFDASFIRQQYFYNGNYYWTIIIDDEPVQCLVREIKNFHPCLIDELKPLFGLEKIGTHSVTIGRRLFLLMKSPGKEHKIVFLDTYDDKKEDKKDDKKDDHFTRKVQEILAFRYLLQMNKTNEKSIAIFTDENKDPFPLDFVDSLLNVSYKKRGVFPAKYYKKWFEDQNKKIGSVLTDLLKLNPETRTQDYAYYRKEMEKIFKRIDKENIAMVNLIMGRLNHLIQ